MNVTEQQLRELLRRADEALDSHGLGACGSPLRCAIREVLAGRAATEGSPLETSDVRWEYEDGLPAMENADFAALFKASRVDGVRLYPFVEDSNGNRIWITHLPSEPNRELYSKNSA